MAMTNINIRIDADKKLKAQELFSSLGLDMTTAINLFICLLYTSPSPRDCS